MHCSHFLESETCTPSALLCSGAASDDDSDIVLHRGVALYDFSPEEEDEVAISKGETVDVEYEVGGWLQVGPCCSLPHCFWCSWGGCSLPLHEHARVLIHHSPQLAAFGRGQHGSWAHSMMLDGCACNSASQPVINPCTPLTGGLGQYSRG